MNAALTHYIVFGPNVWGKAATEAEAMKNMVKASSGSKTKSYDVYQCHPDTSVGGLGDFSYPSGDKPGQFAPVLIRRVRNNKEEAF